VIIINNEIVHMEPTKEFFINALTRDIKLDRTVLDLIDNSIDAARKSDRDFSTFEIRLTLNKKCFIIEDNCDGISKESAKSYAFKFGNSQGKNTRQFSIGHYGIGMKRAFFKIGKMIYVESATREDFFSLFLDVDAWSKSKEWNILFKDSGINDNHKKIGTKIEINKLTDEAKDSFSDEQFIKNLIDTISKTYENDIRRGIKIIVNGRGITISSRDSETEILKYSIDCRNYTAEIIIKKDIPNYNESGWYVKVNDRLVVSADKTELTGWDISSDSKYDILRGYAYIKILKEAPPFNTIKEGLDTSNPIYKELKNYMRKALQEALPKIKGGYFATITYQRPRNEADKLKKILNVKSYKKIGEITYEDYLEKNNIKV